MSDTLTDTERLALLTQQLADVNNGADVMWVLTCAALVVIMQVGFAYVEAGNVRVKNVRSILLKNTVDYVLGGLAYTFIASGMSTGKSWHGIIGTDGYGGNQPAGDTSEKSYLYAVTLYSALFACTTSTIISGAIAERMRLSAYMFLSTISPFVLFALPAHWVWSSDGILNGGTGKAHMVVSDFAGGAVVHATGGMAALTAAWFVGPRMGRFKSNTGYDKDIEGHSVVLGGLGTWLILFGWLGFNAGSSLGISTPDGAYAAALAALNTFLAVLMGALTSILYHTLILGKLNLGEMFNNMLAGAAAITAGCGFVKPVGAVVIGFFGSVAYVVTGPMLAKRFRIDDPLNAVSVHLAAAGVGTILVGFFHETEGLFYSGEATKLAAQTIGLFIILLNATFWTSLALVLYTVLIGPVRVEEKIEVAGCDIELDGIAAYESNENNDIPYIAVRHNKELAEQLNKFLKSIYCYHNVLFLDAIEDYEKGVADPSIDSASVAQALFDNYMCPDGTDPVNVPDWQVTQVERNISSKDNSVMKDLFSAPKAEIHSLLDTTISTHFAHTPEYQRFVKATKKPQSVAPLHFLTKAWCFTNSKATKYGRPKPFDPFKKFKHTEELIESEDEDDLVSMSNLGNSVAPANDSEDSDEEE